MNSDNNQLAVRKPDIQISSISTDSIQRSLEISKGLRDMDYVFNLLPEFLKNLETLLNCSPDLINSEDMKEPWNKMMTFTKENLQILLDYNKKLNSFKVNYNMLMVHLQNFYKNYKENENKLSTKEIVSFFSPHFRKSIKLLEDALSEFEKANKIEPLFEKKDVTECLTELISKIGSKAAEEYDHELKKVKSEVEKSRKELEMKEQDLRESDKKECQEIAKAESEVEKNEKKKLRLQEQNQRNIGKIERLRKEIDENENNVNNTIDELDHSIMTRIQNLEKEKSDLLKQKNSEADRINDDFKKFMHSTEEDLNNLEKKKTEVKNEKHIQQKNSSKFLFWTSYKEDIVYIDTGERGHIQSVIDSIKHTIREKEEIKKRLKEENEKLYEQQYGLLNKEIQFIKDLSKEDMNSQKDYSEKIKSSLLDQIKEIETDSKKNDEEIDKAVAEKVKFEKLIPGLKQSLEEMKNSKKKEIDRLKEELKSHTKKLLDLQNSVEEALTKCGAVNLGHLFCLAQSTEKMKQFIIRTKDERSKGDIFIKSFRDELKNTEERIELIENTIDQNKDKEKMLTLFKERITSPKLLEAYLYFHNEDSQDVLLNWGKDESEKDLILEILEGEDLKLSKLQIKSLQNALKKIVSVDILEEKKNVILQTLFEDLKRTIGFKPINSDNNSLSEALD